MLHLIEMWLEAPVEETDEHGKPSSMEHGRICPGFRSPYSFTVQLQSAGGTCASRKSATRLYASI
jgi:hypothetical protein